MSDSFAQFCAAGLWPGLSRTLRERLPSEGVDNPEHVTVDRLVSAAGVSRTRAERLVTNFEQARPAYEVVEVLVEAGAPARLAGDAVDSLGKSAATQLREDPWRLLSVTQVRPEQADHFAHRVLGATPDRQDPRRGRALVAHLLTRAARDGNTALPATTVASALGGFGVADPAAAVEAAVDEGQVMPFESFDEGAEPRTLLALARYALAEEAIAEGMARLSATAEPLCQPEDVDAATTGLDEDQSAAVRAVAGHGVSVLTGGPGTGKSRTVAAVVELARAQGSEIALAAPTGRAAKRLEELTDEPASTLHRLLQAQGTSGTFARGEHWPLDAEVIVVDETSMLDVELAAALVDACADGTHLLLVGDPAQLPSIGPGRVLADVISAGTAPVTELHTLYRQEEGGVIARLAGSVRGGELPPVESPDREVVIVPAGDGAEAAHRVVQLVTDSIPRALGIPAGDVQVVTPVHRGTAGTRALNQALKRQLNPGEGEHGGFDIGDRVVATANHTDHGFANGEVGVVAGVEDGGLVVTFTAGPVSIPMQLLGDLRHGWAVTVHRAQGSEWPAVAMVLPGDAAGMLSRPLVYTALTRAQRHLSIVHASGPALARAVRDVGERPRRTRLVELLTENAPEAEPA